MFTSCVKPSLVPTRRAPPRPTKRAHSSTRNTQPDKTEVFIQNDGIASYKEVKVKLNNITEPLLQTMQLRNENFVVIQSVDFIEETGIPKFTLKINHKLTFVSFYSGNKCLIKPLSSTGMTVINSISKLEVAFRYLNSLATSNKQNVIINHVKSMRSLTYLGEKKYSSETIARTFECFSISRTLYSRPGDYYQLSSINFLTNLTSKTNTTSDELIFRSVLNKKRNIVFIFDKTYVKLRLTCQGGSVFGKEIIAPDQCATTISAFTFCSFVWW